MDVDAAYEVAKSILEPAAQRLDQIESEEDAKLQLITRMLTEPLGWDFKDIVPSGQMKWILRLLDQRW